MADLEQHAFKRDKRFVVRLVVGLIAASLGGLFVSGWLTSQSTAGCAADAIDAPPRAREPSAVHPQTPGTTAAPK